MHSLVKEPDHNLGIGTPATPSEGVRTTRDVTICTVSFNSRPWIELNHALIKQLNPDSGFTWLVAENSLANSSLRVASGDKRFSVVAGAEFRKKRYASASYHHGAGLNILIEKVRTRFLLVLDPDFFVTRRNWIADVIEYMTRKNVAILGTPWHPGRASKIRYFPSAHCTFFDLEKVTKTDLDFLPDYDNADDWLKEKKTKRTGLRALLNKISFSKRRRIGLSRDTGWIIYEKYRDSGLAIESFQAVYQPKRKRFIEKLIPDRFSLVPKRKGYFRTSGTRTSYFKRMSDLGWEEFYWQSTLFGFHVRCHPKRTKAATPLEDHYETARAVLNELAGLRETP